MEKGSKDSELYNLYCNYLESSLTKKSCSIVRNALTHFEDLYDALSKEDYTKLIGYMYAASAYSLKELYFPSLKEGLYDEIFSTYLSRLKLTVKVDNERHHVDVAEDKEKYNTACSRNVDYCIDDDEGSEGSESSDDIRFSIGGSKPTVIHIQNLNIYLTADVVQQLNMNPQQVINNNADFIRNAAIKAVKDVLENGI